MSSEVLVRWTRDGGKSFEHLEHPPFTKVRAAKAWARTGAATTQFPSDGEVAVLTVEASTRPRMVPVVEWGADEAEQAEGGES